MLEEDANEPNKFALRKRVKSEAADRDEMARETTTVLYLTCNDNNEESK